MTSSILMPLLCGIWWHHVQSKSSESTILILSVLSNLVSRCRNCPEAMLCIVTNPVNSTVPIASKVFEKAGCYNPYRYSSLHYILQWSLQNGGHIVMGHSVQSVLSRVIFSVVESRKRDFIDIRGPAVVKCIE